ncbi:hypothetical protein [Chromobacterium vaccinii]|uniref:hypothetical protein n=1 Tax=Chromobacterium vaccinii TaxID=1108595 RepID=UPI0011850664|nr:hypothetical protein [Chromobacterium vaccinii]
MKDVAPVWAFNPHELAGATAWGSIQAAAFPDLACTGCCISCIAHRVAEKFSLRVLAVATKNEVRELRATCIFSASIYD